MTAKEVLDNLKKPFESKDIEWRMQSSGIRNNKPWGKVLAYVTARAVQDRLDSVLGIDGWTVKYEQLSFRHNVYDRSTSSDKEKLVAGFICTLGIKVQDQWIYKQDAADVTDIETLKGGISSAMKRTASIFGIGRYLYGLEEGWANFCDDGIYHAKIDNNWYKWNPPELPEWALPSSDNNQKPFPQVIPKEPNKQDDFYRQALLTALKSEGIPEDFVLEGCHKTNWIDKNVSSIQDFPEGKAQALLERLPKLKETWLKSKEVK